VAVLRGIWPVAGALDASRTRRCATQPVSAAIASPQVEDVGVSTTAVKPSDSTAVHAVTLRICEGIVRAIGKFLVLVFSAGERLALALRQRAHTRFFGQPTAGVATTRRMDFLPDGAALSIATSPMDRARTRDSVLSIVPDVVTAERVGPGDATLTAATDWLSATSCIATNR